MAAGSVGIAERQTAVYPQASPGSSWSRSYCRSRVV
ncbi:carboxyltransferase domain-containing protein [Pseudomonas aeruginosa]|nr:carboxyltransferase domain-containing protein [Pseudomonas aeruginosa]MDQ4377153.1 carboxyltransferase domain-containing protein [Pseudomonas aeruginosa]